MVSLMDRTPGWEGSGGTRSQTLGRRGKAVRFQQEEERGAGLLSLLHRATSCPWSDDTTFTHRLLASWAHHGQFLEGLNQLFLRACSTTQISLAGRSEGEENAVHWGFLSKT